MPLPSLTLDSLLTEAAAFAIRESTHGEPTLFGMDNGKTIGTYLDQKFQTSLLERYDFPPGNAAKGIDLPGLNVDIKVTSIRKPQSSCPFRSARQKVYGLGYSLLTFVYEKTDDATTATARLDIQHTIFVESERTADFQTTSGLLALLDNKGNRDDILSFFRGAFFAAG